MDWISENSAIIQAGMSAITALIWLVYLHAILSGYRRQRRANILITATGHGLDARCFIANLGLEPIHILGVIVKSELDGEERQVDIPEIMGSSDDESPHLKSIPHGPLTSGNYTDIGPFRKLCGLDRSASGANAPHEGTITVLVIGTTAADSFLAGAKRDFLVVPAEQGAPYLRADSPQTRQIRSRSGRRQLEDELACYSR